MPINKANRIEVRDEGVFKGIVRALDLVGAGVTATVTGDVATITIAAGGGSATTGTAIVDFGTFPGAAYAVVAVASAGVGAATVPIVVISPTASADHTADEHIIDPPDVKAGDVVAGVGFNVHAFTKNNIFHFGTYNVFWSY